MIICELVGSSQFDTIFSNSIILVALVNEGSDKRTINEEHVFLIQEPGTIYLGRVTPNTGYALDIKISVVDFLAEHDVDLSPLMTVGCDGTVVNAVHTGSVIHLLDEELGRIGAVAEMFSSSE